MHLLLKERFKSLLITLPFSDSLSFFCQSSQSNGTIISQFVHWTPKLISFTPKQSNQNRAQDLLRCEINSYFYLILIFTWFLVQTKSDAFGSEKPWLTLLLLDTLWTTTTKTLQPLLYSASWAVDLAVVNHPGELCWNKCSENFFLMNRFT